MSNDMPAPAPQFLDLSQITALNAKKELLKEQIAQARALGQPSGRKYSTWGGALAGGLGDVLGTIASQTKEGRLAEELAKNQEAERAARGEFNAALMRPDIDPKEQERLALSAIASGDPAMGATGQASLANENRMLVRAQAAEREKALNAARAVDDTRQAERDKTMAENAAAQRKLQEEGLDIQRRAANQTRFSTATVVDPVTGKTMAATFNPRTGQYTPTQYGAPAMLGGALAEDKFRDKVLTDLGNDLDPSKGKTNLTTQAQSAYNAAERVETLLHSPGPITKERVHELVLMAATVAAGGAKPTQAQVEGMTPKGFSGDVNSWVQYVTSKPQDAGFQSFLQQIGQQSEREKVTASAQIRRAFLKKLTKHASAFEKYPEQAHRIAKGADLEGLYDPKTLEPLVKIDPVAEAGKMDQAEEEKKSAEKAAKVAQLPQEQAQAMRLDRIAKLKEQKLSTEQIRKTLEDEGLIPKRAASAPEAAK